MAPRMSEEGVPSQHSMAVGCQGGGLLGWAGSGSGRLCQGSIGGYQVEPPSGRPQGVACPAAFCLDPQDLWFRSGGALLPPVGHVSVTQSIGPARSPGE